MILENAAGVSYQFRVHGIEVLGLCAGGLERFAAARGREEQRAGSQKPRTEKEDASFVRLKLAVPIAGSIDQMES